jgi:hypothetical protein
MTLAMTVAFQKSLAQIRKSNISAWPLNNFFLYRPARSHGPNAPSWNIRKAEVTPFIAPSIALQ